MTILEICCEQKFSKPVYNDQVNWVCNTTKLNIKTFMCCSRNKRNYLHLNMYAKVEKT